MRKHNYLLGNYLAGTHMYFSCKLRTRLHYMPIRYIQMSIMFTID